jgi:pimeloyl-ACP methyl ester carboxylesterase
VQVIPSVTLEESLQRCFDHVRENAGEALPAAPTTTPIPGRLWRQVVATAAGECLVSCGGPATSPPVLVLHGAGGSSSTVAPITIGVAQTRAAFAIDLPGHGESDYDVGAGGVSVEACADAVLHVLDAMNLQTVDLVGDAGGALIALELASRHANRVGRLALVNPPKFNPEQIDGYHESGLPSLAPDWFGGHLLRCWHMVRDGRLYFPWFQRDQAGILWRKPDLDERQIQAEVTDYLKADGAWQQLLHSQLAYSLREQLAAGRDGVMLCASRQSPWFESTETIGKKAKLPFTILDGDRDAWGDQIAASNSKQYG